MCRKQRIIIPCSYILYNLKSSPSALTSLNSIPSYSPCIATFTDVSCKLHIRIFKAEEVVFRQRTEPVRDVGPIPESGRSPGVGNGKPLQYSCLENPTDRGI